MWGLRVPARCITAPPGATAASRRRSLKLTVVRRNRAGHADTLKLWLDVTDNEVIWNECKQGLQG